MTIGAIQNFAVGGKVFVPDGPLDMGANIGGPLAPFRLGEATYGDAESEYCYVKLSVITAPLRLNQGDFLAWDNSYTAFQTLTAAVTRGMSIGTFFVGGTLYGAAAAPSTSGTIPALTSGNQPWFYNFTAVGDYGIWVQRSGTSLCNFATTALNTGLAETSATLSRFNAPATPTVGSKLLVGCYLANQTVTFTGNTVSGSAVITATTTLIGVKIGMGISGAGVPANCYVAAINGPSITLGNRVANGSNLATASAPVTITCVDCAFTANTTINSALLTNISQVSGVYPNAVLVGTGIPVGTTVQTLSWQGGNPSILMSALATATGPNIAITSNTYVEGELRGPCYVDKTN